MKRARFTETQIVAVLKEADSGVPVKDACRKHGISDKGFNLNLSLDKKKLPRLLY